MVTDSAPPEEICSFIEKITLSPGGKNSSYILYLSSCSMDATVVASTHQAITKEIREFFFTYSDFFFSVILTLLES